MSEKKKNNPGDFVPIEDCRDRHSKIDLALFGENGMGGIVKKIGDINTDVKLIRENMKSRWTSRDKAYVIVGIGSAIIMAVVALLK